MCAGELQVRNSGPHGHYSGGATARSRCGVSIFPRRTANFARWVSPPWLIGRTRLYICSPLNPWRKALRIQMRMGSGPNVPLPMPWGNASSCSQNGTLFIFIQYRPGICMPNRPTGIILGTCSFRRSNLPCWIRSRCNNWKLPGQSCMQINTLPASLRSEGVHHP